ncbi:hypothetical protein [Acidianus sp. HS-5]|uniref:hypothetical protein n=1 Tax=Acidianus sp. HS-5 TaxID=2886040 RepID=UPI001F219460|nr:hypothetical protein [Acidianus sp. HS-5]BDC19627.1 hypothetical protein HS5_25170 [Acidianus sp. HS-5]
MRLSEIVTKFKLSEESEIEVDSIEFEEMEVDIGTRVLLAKGKRRRIVDLGILSIIYKNCNKEFVKDYLDLTHSLEYVHKKYGVYTELEYLSLNCENFVKDKDVLATLRELKAYILSRENKQHGL